MALPILAHWAGRSIFDIEPAALARRGIRLLLADLDNTLALWGTGAHTGGEGLGGGPGRAGDHPLCALQQPAPGAAPPVFPGAGRALPGPRGQAEAGASGGPWSRWAARRSRLPSWGISSLPTFWAGGTPGCSLGWWSLSAWRAIRGATCATGGVALPHVEQRRTKPL